MATRREIIIGAISLANYRFCGNVADKPQNLTSFDNFADRPQNLTSKDAGKLYLYTQTGTWHKWSGTSWEIKDKSRANVKDYGAIGDGIADDTTAIQLAINQCPLVYIPAGAYLIRSVLSVNKATTIKGDGHGQSIIKAFYSDAIKITSSECEVRDLQIQTSSQHLYIGISVDNVYKLRLSNIFLFGNYLIAIKLLRTSQLRADNLHVEAVNSDRVSITGIGILADSCINCVISSAHIQGYDKGISMVAPSIAKTPECQGMRIVNTSVLVCNIGLFVEFVSALYVSGGIFDYNYQNSIYIKKVLWGSISDNYIGGSSLLNNTIQLKIDMANAFHISKNTITIDDIQANMKPGCKGVEIFGYTNTLTENYIGTPIGGTIDGNNSNSNKVANNTGTTVAYSP